MEWQQLEYFQAVARLQHFTQAAERLSVSQSALSRSIAQLERELGVPLFDRRGRAVVLNEPGRRLLEHTTRILQEMQDARRTIGGMRDPEYGRIALAFLKSLGIRDVPRMVRAYMDEHPHVQFHLFQNSTSAMIDQLLRGEADLMLSSLTDASPEVEWAPLWTEALYIVAHKDHALAKRSGVRFAELGGERFIVLKPGYGSRAVFDAACEAAKTKPVIAFEGEEVVSVLEFVAANLGIALLPRVSGTTVSMDGLALLPVEDCVCERTIGLAWIRGKYMPPAAEQFREYVLRYGRDRG